MRHGRKGISELVAALLLVSIVIAGSLIVYVYSSGLLGSLQGAQPQTSYTDQVTLEYYDWTNLGFINLTVRNTGSAVVTLDDFFVGNSTWIMQIPSSSVVFYTGCESPPGQLTVQASCKIDLKNLTGITRGVAYTVKIVTAKGAILRYSLIAGSLTTS